MDKPPAPIDGWIIALAGQVLIGKPVKSATKPCEACFKIIERASLSCLACGATQASPAASIRLSPVYSFLAQAQPSREGQMTIQYAVLPLLWLGSIRSIDLPPGCPIVECDSLNRTERRALEAVVLQAEQMVGNMRAAASGIALAPAPPGKLIEH